ncbi:MAG: ABC transporter ATP-binding protein [Henriciella sp.]
MNTQNAASLVCQEITKSFAGRTVVDQASLILNTGELTALVGSSGAGKTTLLRLLAGMEKPDSGTISNGETVLSTAQSIIPPERRRIGLVFQDFALFPHMTVTGNICFGLYQLPKPERLKTAKSWIDRLGLAERAEAFPHELSGGEQQRVAIARALAPVPVAILMDEPFSGLDPTLRDQARQVAIEAIREAGTPALLVTHDAAEAMAFADKICIINDGQIIQTGSSADLYQRPTSLAAAKALGRVLAVNKSTLPTELQQTCPSTQTIYMRPEALEIDPKGKAEMILKTVKQVGPSMMLELDYNGTVFFAQSPAANLTYTPGPVRVSLNPASVFSF